MAETANELLDQALAAGNAGRFDEAAAKFTELIARSPKVPDLSLWYMERADAYVHGGHYDLAWADLAQAIALDPKHAKEHYLQGFILDERHQLQPGIEAYSKAIAIDSKDADSFYNRGCDYYQLGRFDAAIADFTKTIEIDNKQASAYTNRGTCYSDLGRLDAALADLSKAIALNPQSLNAYTNRARVHMQRKEWDDAIKDCDAALRLTPNNDVLTRMRAEAQARVK